MAIRARGRCSDFGEKCDQRFVCFSVDGRRGQCDLHCVGVDACYAVLSCAGMQPHCQRASVWRRRLRSLGPSDCGLGYAAAEDGGADSDAGAALFDGYGEVVRHSHGELRHAREASCQIRRAGGGVRGSRGGLVSASSDQGGTVIRPTASMESSSSIAARREGSSPGARPCFDSSWLSLTSIRTGQLFSECCCGGVQALGDLQGVDGVDCVEELGGLCGFVRLERADEVEVRVRSRSLTCGDFS